MKSQFEARNLSMMMDLYELTMANAIWKEKGIAALEEKAAFDVFFRRNPDGGGFSIFCGLEQVLDYIKNFHFAPQDIEYLRHLKVYDEGFLEFLASNADKFDIEVIGLEEGTICYPNEPLITVIAPMIFAQLLETEILTQINHQSLIATKASRIVRSAKGKAVSDFGARRAHNNDAAIYGARAAYIGGVKSTATVSAGQYFGIPVSGTMAHSWVMAHDSELDAFMSFAKIYPDNCILLIDTYNTLTSGVINACKTFDMIKKEIGRDPKCYGVRIDSGDLAYLSKAVRKILDANGHHSATIVVSNSLDEYTIASLIEQGACIDAFGVGERLITSKSDPVFGAVYKLAAIIDKNGGITPKIKVSDNLEKITNPGIKYVWRIHNSSDGKAIGDVITDGGWRQFESDNDYVDPKFPWKPFRLEESNHLPEKLTKWLFLRKGGCIYHDESCGACEARHYVEEQLRYDIREEEQRFTNPDEHSIWMPVGYYRMKQDLLSKSK